jgi:hypothetical protein
MAARPVSDWLNVEESAQLLHAIFPNYPALYPCRPAPPKQECYLIADLDPAGPLTAASRTDHFNASAAFIGNA